MKKTALIITAILICAAASAQDRSKVKYGEENVPDYVLPELLTCNDGTKVTTAKQWETKRRPEVMEYFYSQEYGHTPAGKTGVRYEQISENKQALGGKATMRQVRFIFSNGQKEMEAVALVFIPNNRKGKVPVFVGYNFKGNHSTIADESIVYTPNFSLVKKPDNPDWVRGCQANRWCFEKIIDRGYAIITMCYNDIYPDAPAKEMRDHSVCSLFPDYRQHAEWSDGWGAIGAWAWGSSRMADWLETQKWADCGKLIVIGHSRQGKAALWAGAQDTRFKVVISNDSGCSGAALSKRMIGENINVIYNTFPHWFCPAYKFYDDNEAALPFDQHELIACIAPRFVYVASAAEDNWADQKGEFLATSYAGPVYELYGMKGLGTTEMPGIHQPIMHDAGYHIRAGVHDVTDYDWERYMDFCDMHFGKKK